MNGTSNHHPISPRSPTEVTSKATRRRFTAEYKRKIVQEADACTQAGEVGALLRREGLYSSHLVNWRAASERGELAGLAPKKRGPKAMEPNPLAKELAAERREVARLKAENAKLQIICEVQKKVSLLLGVTLPTIPDVFRNGRFYLDWSCDRFRSAAHAERPGSWCTPSPGCRAPARARA